DNESTVLAQAGHLALTGGDPSPGGITDPLYLSGGEAGSWSASTGASVDFAAGTYKLADVTPMSGAINVNGGSVAAGMINGGTAADLSLSSGTLNFDDASNEDYAVLHSLTLTGGIVTGDGGVEATA